MYEFRRNTELIITLDRKGNIQRKAATWLPLRKQMSNLADDFDSGKDDALLKLKSTLHSSREHVGGAVYAALSNLQQVEELEDVVEEGNNAAVRMVETSDAAAKHFGCMNLKATIMLIITIVCVLFIAIGVIGGGVVLYLKPWEAAEALEGANKAAPPLPPTVAPAPAPAPAPAAAAAATVAAAAVPVARRLLRALLRR